MPSLPEALRQQSDFVLEFLDQDNLILRQLNDTHGEIAIASKLYCLDSDCVISRHDPWIEWNDNVPERVRLHENESLIADQLYYVYLPAADVDAFNFNDVNPSTRRPWSEDDEGAETHYDPDLDLRLWPFLSPQAPDHGRLSEQSPGWYARHIGQVEVDATRRFRNATDISAIRQPTLNPTYFDGLAEIQWTALNPEEFMVSARKGTSGIVMVGGEGVQCCDSDSSGPLRIANSDPTHSYNEATIDAPLTAEDSISSHPNEELYVYLGNSQPCWGTLANKLFVSARAPTRGYLSRNWPGNQARWLGTIRTDPQGKFTGTFVIESVAADVVRVNDWGVSLFETWSSAKISSALLEMTALINANTAYTSEQASGLAGLLVYQDASHVKFQPLDPVGLTVTFPDLTNRIVPGDGLSLAVTGSTGTIYYCYLGTEAFYISTDAPDQQVGSLQLKGTDILVGYVGCAAQDYLDGYWNVYSAFHQATRICAGASWNGSTLWTAYPGLLVPPVTTGSFSRTGGITIHGNYGGTSCTVSVISGDCSNRGYPSGVFWEDVALTVWANLGWSLGEGVYSGMFQLFTSGSASYTGTGGTTPQGWWLSNNGELRITVPGT